MHSKTTAIMSDGPVDGSPVRGATGERVNTRKAGTSLLYDLEQSVGESPLHPQFGSARTSGATAAPGLYAVYGTPGQASYRMVDAGLPDYTVARIPRMFDTSNPQLTSYLADARPDRVFLVLDPRVEEYYGAGCRRYFQFHNIDHVVLDLPRRASNEWNKDAKAWTELLERLLEHRPVKRDLLFAIGGGVTHDLVGFTAATLRRGMPYWAIPTTLAAQIDAAISPKTAIDVGPYKNAAGVVYPAEFILYDPAMLGTLDRSPLLTGMAELVKIAIVRCAPLFRILELEGLELLDRRFQGLVGYQLIDAAIRIFLGMKWEHPFPGNSPASLRSFGHGFSREVEASSQFTLTHGEAVSAEMAIASCLSNQVGILGDGGLERIFSLLMGLGLPVWCRECNAHALWPVFARRFERGENFYFPIPGDRIGSGAFLERFTKEQLARAIAICSEREQRERAAA